MFLSRLTCAVAVSAVLGFSTGCSSSKRGTPEPGAQASVQQAPSQPGSEQQLCPMTVPGAQARAQDVPEGVALIISTSEPDQVAELQQRTRRMLQQQQESTQRAQQETAMGRVQEEEIGDTGMEEQLGKDDTGQGGSGMAGAPTMPSSARVQDTPDGVTILYVAADPAQQKQLSSEVHRNADQMQPGRCPGMSASEY